MTFSLVLGTIEETPQKSQIHGLEHMVADLFDTEREKQELTECQVKSYIGCLGRHSKLDKLACPPQCIMTERYCMDLTKMLSLIQTAEN